MNDKSLETDTSLARHYSIEAPPQFLSDLVLWAVRHYRSEELTIGATDRPEYAELKAILTRLGCLPTR